MSQIAQEVIAQKVIKEKNSPVESAAIGAAKVLSDHTSYVTNSALFSDNKRVLSASADNTLRLWNLEKDVCEKILSGHTGYVTSVSLSPDNQQAISGSTDNTLRLWNIRTGVCDKVLLGHTSDVNCVTIMPDGQYALSGGSDKTMRLWNLKTGVCEKVFPDHSSDVTCVAISHDAQFALSGSDDSTLRLWNLKTGACVKPLAGHSDAVLSVVFTADGQKAISGSADNTVRVWNLRAGACEKVFSDHTAAVFSVALTADNQYALSGSGDDTLRVWNLSSGLCMATKKFDSEVYAVNQFVVSDQLYSIVGLSSGQIHVAHTLTLPKSKADLDNKEPEEPRIKTEQDTIQLGGSSKIEYKDLIKGKVLGQGGFGIVYQGTWRHVEVAIKQSLLDERAFSKGATLEFESEVKVMARLRSPNIIQFYGYCLNPKYCIVMEYMPLGSLYSVLKSEQAMAWPLRIKIATDIACGLAFLHQEKIFHRDVKSLNVLLDEQYRAKLTDFGLSKIKSETRVSTATSKIANDSVGTLAWMAPELFKRKGVFTAKSDIYSFGITLWELAARKLPFADAANPNLIQSWVEKGEREEIPEDCPKKLSSLIEACWDGDADKRPDSDTVIRFLRSDKEDFKAFLPGFQSAVNSASASVAQSQSAAAASSPAAKK